MSGFLERIAARSVGAVATAVAQPRLPAVFEEPAFGGAGLEVIDEEIVAPAPQTPPAPMSLRAGTSGHAPGGQAVRATARRHGASAATPERAGSRAPHAQALSATPAADEPAPAVAALAHEAARTSVDGAAPLLGEAAWPVPAAPAAIVPAVAAIPAAQATPVPPERSEAACTQSAAEAPAVRVHIGRLEVRANLQTAPPAAPAPPREKPRTEGLALSAYLRGERGIR